MARGEEPSAREFGDPLRTARMIGARPGELRHTQAHAVGLGRLVVRRDTTIGYEQSTDRQSRRDRIIDPIREGVIQE